MSAEGEWLWLEARFPALVDHNDALITIVDENARALYASPSYAWILGYTPDELLAWPDLWPIVHPDDVAWMKEQRAEVVCTTRSVAAG